MGRAMRDVVEILWRSAKVPPCRLSDRTLASGVRPSNASMNFLNFSSMPAGTSRADFRKTVYAVFQENFRAWLRKGRTDRGRPAGGGGEVVVEKRYADWSITSTRPRYRIGRHRNAGQGFQKNQAKGIRFVGKDENIGGARFARSSPCLRR